MRYLILQPTVPMDPRSLKLASVDDLHERCPHRVECLNERHAVTEVRRMTRSAVAMMLPLEIGSGTTVLLGFVADEAQRRMTNLAHDIRFCMFVHAITENEPERTRLRKQGPAAVFTRELWRVKPENPDLYKRHSVEVRATDAEVPVFTDACVGVDQSGRLVMFIEAAGVQFSVHFDDKHLELAEKPPVEDRVLLPVADPDRSPTPLLQFKPKDS